MQATDYYYPFGANRGGSAFSELTAKQFTGQYGASGLAGSEGLNYYGARWYDAQLGRFVSADTIVPRAGDAQAFNRYAYVRNSPMMRVDPSGHGDCNIHIERCLPDDAALRYPLSQLTVENFYRYFAQRTTKSDFYVAPQHEGRLEAAAYEYKVIAPRPVIPPPKLGPPSPVQADEVYDYLRSAPRPYQIESRRVTANSAVGSCLVSLSCDYQILSVGGVATINIMFANNDEVYVALGVSAAVIPVSVSFADGHIDGKGEIKASEFLKGLSVNTSVGTVVDVGRTWSIGTGYAWETGIGSPNAALTVSYTFFKFSHNGMTFLPR